MNCELQKQSLTERAERLVAAARDVIPSARIVIRKPGAMAYILLDAHRTQLVLGVVLIFLMFLAPPIVDSFTGTLFPPETSTKVFGLIKTQQANPAKEVLEVIIMTTLWLVSIISALLLFWLHIPAGLARANARARILLVAGDRQANLAKSRDLYKRALAIATEHELEFELDARLKKGKPSGVSSTGQDEVTVLTRLGQVGDDDALAGTFQPAIKNNAHQTQPGLNQRYILGPELGRGAMGAVFLARDDVLDRQVAIKQLSLVLSGEEEYTLRFRQEARALARLTHHNIVQVYDLIEEGGRLWMVLEYIDGGDLASYLKEKGRLAIDEAAMTIIPVAEGLAFAHGQGIVHRDLKPANILLTKSREPKISDFGIAKLSQSTNLTQVGSVLGSPPYMSPEQCSGDLVDARTDIYALGITLYELLSGKRPFEGETSSVMAKQIIEPPPPLSDLLENIPPELESLIMRMLAKRTAERPSDINEVIAALSAFGARPHPQIAAQSGHTSR
jgi:hypothetical protein